MNGLHEHLALFVAIADTGSLSAAATITNIPQPSVSRQLAALERRMGVRLVERTTRALRLTEQGEILLSYARKAVQLAQEAEDAVRQDARLLRGTLRVGCSHAFGRKIVMPALPEWMARHPRVGVELLMKDQLSALVEDHVDVAIRLAPLSDSSLIARRIGSFERVAVASKAYLRRRAAPASPANLADHECLVFSGAQHPNAWSISGPQGSSVVHVTGRLRVSSVDALQDAVLAGLGVAVTPAWFWSALQLEDEVERVLPKYRFRRQDIYAVTASRPGERSKVRLFCDYLEGRLKSLGLGVQNHRDAASSS
jgi:DNA-binding transcriptional LysR family regulator